MRLLFVLTVLVGPGLIWADQQQSELELSDLKARIDQVKADLAVSRREMSDIEAEIDALDRKIADLALGEQRNQQELAGLNQQKETIGTELRKMEGRDERNQDALAQLVRANYMLKRQDSLMLLLNRRSPSDIARTVAMYRYVVESRHEQLQQIRRHIQEVQQARQEIDQRTRDIDVVLAQLERDRNSLDSTRQKRQARLDSIQADMTSGQQQVHLFRLREVELRILLENLQQQSLVQGQAKEKAAISAQSQNAGSDKIKETGGNPEPANKSSAVAQDQEIRRDFARRRGSLALPASARVRYRFGQRKPDSELNWEGLMLGVNEGQQVKAVYDGQVVFSDWFRGYGQLLVIDHGQGYLSLYGHNQILHADLGSRVREGQLIASAGSTGGLVAPGLYFEIRHNGIPSDPLQWCTN